MSWSRRALLIAPLIAAACGFSPVYGPGGTGGKLFGKVRTADPKSPDDFAFAGRIAERMGAETSATYQLDWEMRIAVVPQAITPEEVTTRYALNGSVIFTLTEAATGRPVTRGQVSSFTSYSTTGTTIATMAAEQDAHKRLARLLADMVVTRLMAVDPATIP
ncbi:LPS assembly lipoprotein LptE [Paracoccus sp. CPCC 101403]|uniref:LPS assembly lipoprotein LptE n=2 Tax=Paracoccus broussonetiae TaxID=3075834 RepID=A0ABU3EEX6_9RHOB|nr:LPS assembly lipoprotein LptE [Paracoccus sp. CPCC 101403]MDT1062791.1 LPS assembly lipoprotein LptE [Paracoccus sp. CPCC 101403]